MVKRFPNSDSVAVDHLSLDIEEGEAAVLVGPSGCGKTTMMKMINRLEEPSSGELAGLLELKTELLSPSQ